MHTRRIAVFGEYNEETPGHRTIAPSLEHSGSRLGCSIEACWVRTDAIYDGARLSDYDGFWAAPRSPYASFDGMLAGIRYARENNQPFLGTCGGFQYALIEFARNVLGIPNADSAENDPGAENIVISPVSCPSPHRGAGDPRLVGRNRLTLVEGTRLRTIFGTDAANEIYFCNFEVNTAFEERLSRAGAVIDARGPNGEIRAFELPNRDFFFASLFQPQLGSTPEQPHPLITAFVEAVVGQNRALHTAQG